MNNKIEIIINVNTMQTQKGMQSLQNTINGSLRNMQSSFLKFGAGLAGTAAALKGIEVIGQGLYSLFSNGLELIIKTERAEAGIAGLIASVYELKDASGKLVEGPEKFVKALELSREQVRKIRIDAITSSLSADELTDAYMQAVGPGAAAGLDEDKVRQLTLAAGQAGKVMLPRAGMLPQELRSLLSGKIDKNATIGSALQFGAGGKNQKDYQEALRTGKAFEYLTDKLKEFNKAAQLQSQGIGGTFDQIKDISKTFSMDSSTGLADELKKLQPLIDNLFDKKTKTWSAEMQPIVAFFNTIGRLIGKEILGGIQQVVEWTKQFGAYIMEDQSFINGIIQGWEGVKDIAKIAWGIIGDIFDGVVDIARGLFSLVNPEIGESGKGLTAMQTTMILLNALVGGFAIAFGAVKDVVTLIVGGIKVLVGQTIKGIAEISVFAGNVMAKLSDKLNMKDAAKGYREDVEKNMKRIELGDKISFDNNKLVQQIEKNGFLSGITQNTQQAFQKAIERINMGGQGTNNEFTKTWNDMIAEMERNRRKPTTTTVPGGGNQDNGKKQKVRSMANALYSLEKARLEGEIDLNKEKAREEEAILEDKFKNNLITAKEYYDEKRKLTNKDYEDQMRLLQQEKKEALAKGADNPAQVIQNKVEAEKIEQKILLLKLKQVNAVADLNREELNYLNTKKKEAALDDAENKKLDGEHKLALDKINADQLLQLKQINNAQSLQMEKSRIDEEYRIESESLKARLELARDNLDEQRTINNERLALDRKYAEQRAKIDSDIKMDSMKDAIEIQQSFEDNFTTLIEDIQSGKKSFLDSIKDFAKAIEAEFSRLAARKLAAQVFGDGGAAGGGGLLSGIGSWFSTGLSGGGWSLPSFAVGTDYVPNDMIAQIHKGERIVPAKYNNENYGGGVNVTNHFIMNETPDTRTQGQMAAEMSKALSRANKRNN